jgi:hypothetical protein
MIFFDTESCGLHGPIVLIQWARDDGHIYLYSVWYEEIQRTLKLIRAICNEEDGIVGFNLAHDWFHICKTYTTLLELQKRVGEDACPISYINEYADCEPQARFGSCLKPKTAMDLMLHARKGPYQSTMNRDPIRIKRVPTILADDLAKELDRRIPLKDVYFARKKDIKRRWMVSDIKDDFGDIEVDFKDLVLTFAPSSALKALAQDALGVDTNKIKLFADVELSEKLRPVELGYAPFAYAIGKLGQWNGAWPSVIRSHISHWAFNKYAREYATDDVVYTRGLYRHFDNPKPGDDDSILACMVGAVRWRGYRINTDRIKQLRKESKEVLAKTKFNFNSPEVCRRYLTPVLSDTEKCVMKVGDKITTKAVVLEEIAKWREEEVCNYCNGMIECDKCDDGLTKSEKPHPAALRAQEILDARHMGKEIELYDKLLKAGRFHAAFVVVGTRSSRMAGDSGLNPQGIKSADTVRECFPLYDDGLVLCGGDFKAFEVVLMDATYNDPILRKDLVSGKSMHGLFGTYLFPGMTYDQIMATKGLPGEKDKYKRSKNGVFAVGYGGEEYTLMHRVGISEQAANEGYQRWINRYKVWGQERRKDFDMFCSMRQPNGIGTKVEWHKPADYVESAMGFRRYFTLENRICELLFNLASDPPKHWTDIRMQVVRRDRKQTVSGAVRSALFACAFALQASNMRAAGNHKIQSFGATLCKLLQRKIWDHQPAGIGKWVVQPMNVHDEIMCPAIPEIIPALTRTVNDFVENTKPIVPLIGIDWHTDLETWAGKSEKGN